MKEYQPPLRVNINISGHEIKIADTPDEIQEAINLIKKIFCKDFEITNENVFIDEPHINYNYLIVKDKTNKIKAVYRIVYSDHSSHFYTQSEFDLSSFLNTSEKKLEVSRMCICPDSRTGTFLKLLFMGIVHLIKTLEIKYLFGVSSIQKLDKETILNIINFLKTNDNIHHLVIEPVEKCRFLDPNELSVKNEHLLNDVKLEIPPILMHYIKIGAKVCQTPAIDHDFKCIDFLTILDCSQMTNLYAKYLDKYASINKASKA